MTGRKCPAAVWKCGPMADWRKEMAALLHFAAAAAADAEPWEVQ